MRLFSTYILTCTRNPPRVYYHQETQAEGSLTPPHRAGTLKDGRPGPSVSVLLSQHFESLSKQDIFSRASQAFQIPKSKLETIS